MSSRKSLKEDSVVQRKAYDIRKDSQGRFELFVKEKQGDSVSQQWVYVKYKYTKSVLRQILLEYKQNLIFY